MLYFTVAENKKSKEVVCCFKYKNEVFKKNQSLNT